MMDKPKKHEIGVLCALLSLAMFAADAAAQVKGPLRSRDLSRKYMQAHAAGDYAKAIEIGLQWVRLKPKNITAAYNLACVYALNGDKKDALQWLAKSVALGWDDPGHLQRDTDLDSLHSEPEFDKIVGQARERQKPRLERAGTGKPLIVPPSSLDNTKPAPLIIAMHGYGGNAENFSRVWADAAGKAGAILVIPRAMRSVSMSGFGWGDLDEAEVIVKSALSQAMSQHNVDTKRVVLTGFSQGASMAYGIAERAPSAYAGVIPVAGRLAGVSSTGANVNASTGPKYYLMIGADDREATVESNRSSKRELSAAGFDVSLVVYPDLGHAFPPNRDAELTRALAYVLGK